MTAQRRDRAHRYLSSDSLINECAQEGATFRLPVPSRDEPGQPSKWTTLALAVCAVILCAVIAFALPAGAHL